MTMMTITPEKLNSLSESQNEQFIQVLNNIVSKCWEDSSFRNTLSNDPISICREHGLNIEGFNNVEVSDREALEGELVLRIPPKPSTSELEALELPEEELEKQAGGITPATPSILLTASIIESIYTVCTIVRTLGGRTEDDWRDKGKGPKKGGG